MAALAQQQNRKVRCLSCKEEYGTGDAGTCKECYEEASETEEELKREIEDLKSKLAFLRFWSPAENPSGSRSHVLSFSDVVLVASEESGPSAPVPAHRSVLVSDRRPFFLPIIQFTAVI